MIAWLALLAITLVSIPLIPVAQAQAVAPLLATCTGTRGVDWTQQIKSCSAIIASKQATAAERAQAYRNRGIAHFTLTEGQPVTDDESGKLREAAFKDLSEAVRLDPKDARVYYFRGLVQYYSGDIQRALEDYDAAIRIDPNYSDAYLERGRVHLRRGDLKAAIANYSEAIRTDPDNVDAYDLRAGAYKELGEPQRAIADYTEAIRIDPKHGGTYASRAGAFVDTGELERAAADLTAAIQLEPNQGEFYGHRGLVQFFRGIFADAAADLLRAQELRTESAIPTTTFRYLARRRAGQVEADPELAKAAAGFKFVSPEIQLFLGRISVEQMFQTAGSFDRCRSEFYAGQWHLLREERDAAQVRLRAASDAKCRPSYYYPGSPFYRAAVIELTRLGPARARP